MLNRHPILGVATLASQALNNWIPGKYRHHDLTVSARCYIQRNDPGWRVAHRLVNWLFFWQENHCKDSFLLDVDFAKQILEVEL